MGRIATLVFELCGSWRGGNRAAVLGVKVELTGLLMLPVNYSYQMID